MAIADLKARQGNVTLVAELIEKGDAREFDKFGKKGRVCNAKIKDDSGEVSLTLWNDDIDKVSVGNTIKITNGWVGEYQGELQLSTGKFGKLEVVGKDEAAATSAAPAETEPKKPKFENEELNKIDKEMENLEEEEHELEEIGEEEDVKDEEE